MNPRHGSLAGFLLHMKAGQVITVHEPLNTVTVAIHRLGMEHAFKTKKILYHTVRDHKNKLHEAIQIKRL